MLKPGQTVTIYEDPITQLKPEGKATIIKFEGSLGDGLAQYYVHFVGDPRGLHVLRLIEDAEDISNLCCCMDPVQTGDNPNCRVHWVGR